jgi:hypothetical protein
VIVPRFEIGIAVMLSCCNAALRLSSGHASHLIFHCARRAFESGRRKNWRRILSIGFRGVSAESLQRGDDADEDVGVPSGNISAFSRTGCYVLEFSKSSAHHKLEIAHIESW